MQSHCQCGLACQLSRPDKFKFMCANKLFCNVPWQHLIEQLIIMCVNNEPPNNCGGASSKTFNDKLTKTCDLFCLVWMLFRSSVFHFCHATLTHCKFRMRWTMLWFCASVFVSLLSSCWFWHRRYHFVHTCMQVVNFPFCCSLLKFLNVLVGFFLFAFSWWA